MTTRAEESQNVQDSSASPPPAPLPFAPEAPRLGILGGSFNPPHLGHVLQARHAAAFLGLTRLDVLPAASPPHKSPRGLLPFALRLDLTRAAMAPAGIPGLRVDDREGRRAGPSYTVDTLREYVAELPGWEIIFLMGSIDLPTLPSWKEGQRINELVHLAVHPREDDDACRVAALLDSGTLGGYTAVPSPLAGASDTGGTGARDGMCGAVRCWRKTSPPGKLLWYLECSRLPVHATGIRELWNQGAAGLEALRAQLPAAVLALLQERREQVDAVWRPQT